jgi:hypothetical protein
VLEGLVEVNRDGPDIGAIDAETSLVFANCRFPDPPRIADGESLRPADRLPGFFPQRVV